MPNDTSSKKMIACEYCRSANPTGKKYCIACGAPLPELNQNVEPRPLPQIKRQTPTYIPPSDLQKVRKTGEDVDKIATTALSVYSYLWRSLAEAVVIAITGSGIGLVGGATGMPVVGVLGACAAGFAVGWAIKIYYLVLVSAPAGFVIGAAISAVFWFIGVPPQAMSIPIILFTCIAALFGSRKFPYRYRNVWEKLRPFLGTAGGLAFGLLGMAAGAGIRAAVMALLN